MAEGETKQLQSHRLTYRPPSQMQSLTAGRGKVAKEALTFVPSIPRKAREDLENVFPSVHSMNKTAIQQSCPCERRTKNILCQACGHVFVGRIRRICPLHPTTIHLMDINCCPECRANHLKEFSDFCMKRD